MQRVRRGGVAIGLTIAAVVGGALPVEARDRTRPSSAADAHRVGVLPVEDVAFVDHVMGAALAAGAVGVTVSVEVPGRGRLVRSWGTANLATGEPLTPRHHVRMGSITKTFVAVALLQQVDRGRLRLDDRVSRYVAGVPDGNRITVRQVLGMQSGVTDFVEDDKYVTAHLADPLLPGWGPDDAVRIMRRRGPAFAPGERTEYSNSNYILAGLILEKVTGRPVGDVLRDDITRPLRLDETGLPRDEDLPAPAASGYDTNVAPPRDATRSNPGVAWTAGAMVSTVADLHRWAEFLASGTTLSRRMTREQQTFAPLTAAPVFGYGLGIMKLGEWVGHNGSIDGYTTVALHRPRTGATVVVAVDSTGGEETDATALFVTLAGRLQPGSVPPPPWW